jgi:hypothetical protein
MKGKEHWRHSDADPYINLNCLRATIKRNLMRCGWVGVETVCMRLRIRLRKAGGILISLRLAVGQPVYCRASSLLQSNLASRRYICFSSTWRALPMFPVYIIPSRLRDVD